MMARIKHIALHTEDPVKTAEFYKEVSACRNFTGSPETRGKTGSG
jgi:hypothetical protein